LSKSIENEFVKKSPSKEHKYGMRPRKPKLSIDLNKPTPQEYYGECGAETWDTPWKQNIE
jgi:hypothetical protein